MVASNVVVSELLLALGGHPAAPSHNASQSSSDLLHNDTTTDSAANHSAHTLLSSLSSLADRHNAIIQNCRELRQVPALTIQTIVTSVEQQLQVFNQLVVDCDVLITYQDLQVMVEGELSLVKLVSRFRSSETLLAHLNRLTSQLLAFNGRPNQRLHSGRVLDLLREQSNTGYLCLKDVTKALLSSAETIFLLQLRTWLVYGTLRSLSPLDFFIQSDSDSGTGFRLNLQQRPRILTTEVATEIFELGLIVVTLHNEKLLYSIGSYDTPYVHQQAQFLAAVQSPIQAHAIETAVRSLSVSLSRNVLSRVISQNQIMDALQFMENYFLLTNGEFALSLVDLAYQEFQLMQRRHLGHLRSRTLHALLAKAITNVESAKGIEEDISEDTSLLSMRLLDDSEVATAPFSSFLFGVPARLDYNIKWPMNFLLAQEDVQIYSFLFDYLVSIHRAQKLLRDLWRDRRQEIVRPIVARPTWNTALRSLIFLEKLSEYYYVDVIGDAHKTLKTKVEIEQEIYNPNATAALHRTMIQGIAKTILPNEKFVNLMRKFLVSIDVMLASMNKKTADLTVRSQHVTDLIRSIVSVLAIDTESEALLTKLHIEQEYY